MFFLLLGISERNSQVNSHSKNLECFYLFCFPCKTDGNAVFLYKPNIIPDRQARQNCIHFLWSQDSMITLCCFVSQLDFTSAVFSHKRTNIKHRVDSKFLDPFHEVVTETVSLLCRHLIRNEMFREDLWAVRLWFNCYYHKYLSASDSQRSFSFFCAVDNSNKHGLDTECASLRPKPSLSFSKQQWSFQQTVGGNDYLYRREFFPVIWHIFKPLFSKWIFLELCWVHWYDFLFTTQEIEKDEKFWKLFKSYFSSKF